MITDKDIIKLEKHFATKEDIKNFATKSELRQLSVDLFETMEKILTSFALDYEKKLDRLERKMDERFDFLIAKISEINSVKPVLLDHETRILYLEQIRKSM